MLSRQAVPLQEQVNSPVTLAVSKHGGHVGLLVVTTRYDPYFG